MIFIVLGFLNVLGFLLKPTSCLPVLNQNQNQYAQLNVFQRKQLFSCEAATNNFLNNVAPLFLHAPKSNFNYVDDNEETIFSINLLEKYNQDYLSRMKQGRILGLTPAAVTLQRAQELKASGIKKERHELKQACCHLAKVADEITIGIMAESGSKGIQYLKAWTDGLNLPTGIITAVDANNNQIQANKNDAFQNDPVYIKYTSTENGNAYIKKYDGNFVGILFQPRLENDHQLQQQVVFRQYGDLPPAIF